MCGHGLRTNIVVTQTIYMNVGSLASCNCFKDVFKTIVFGTIKACFHKTNENIFTSSFRVVIESIEFYAVWGHICWGDGLDGTFEKYLIEERS